MISNAPKAHSTSGIYKIPCNDCEKFYIGETGRSISTRVKEHKYAVSTLNVNNGLANYVLNSNHSINFNDSTLMYHCKDFKVRHVVESAFIKHYSSSLVNLNSGLIDINDSVASLLVNSIKSNLSSIT